MSDLPVLALASLLDEIRKEGAITVQTPLGDRPGLAAETNIHLGGSVVVKVDPSVTADDPRWEQHQRDVAARLHPLEALRSWTDDVQRIETAVRRVVSVGAGIAAPLGAARSVDALRGLLWAAIPAAFALLAHYAARPLVVRVVTWALRRALASIQDERAPGN
jgi:hypothetical protein